MVFLLLQFASMVGIIVHTHPVNVTKIFLSVCLDNVSYNLSYVATYSIRNCLLFIQYNLLNSIAVAITHGNFVLNPMEN